MSRFVNHDFEDEYGSPLGQWIVGVISLKKIRVCEVESIMQWRNDRMSRFRLTIVKTN